MAKKKTKKAAEEAAPMEEAAKEPVMKPAEKPAAPKSALWKNLALAGLIVLAIILAFYFTSSSDTSFVPGSAVDAETFKNNFEAASRIFIVMDIRGVTESALSNNILQCGVDFAGSSGMGPKNATYVSVDDDGCVAPDGRHETKECFGWLRNGQTIYIKQGDAGAKYYSNGMVVNVGRNYTLGTCGIHRI